MSKRVIKSVLATLAAFLVMGLLCVGVYYLPDSVVPWVVPVLGFVTMSYVLYTTFYDVVFKGEDR